MSTNSDLNLLISDLLKMEPESIKRSLANRLTYTIGKDSYTATKRDWLHSLTYVARDRLIEKWMNTMRSYYQSDSKRVYYLSLEFLMGRAISNSLLNMDYYDACQQAMAEMGLDLEEICKLEYDAALGNGGLGRLAACFLDSMATLDIPGYGYGIRYEFGMFTQRIENGKQVEHPDNWLRYGNPWEFPRPEVLYPVKFYGRVVTCEDDTGQLRHYWMDTEDVMAMAYDIPIPGCNTSTVNNLRLWSAKATRDFNLQYFNEGNYIKAVEDKTHSENLSKVLYPNDANEEGRRLRLMQQYFFVSASLQDIFYRFCKHHDNFDQIPDKVAIQLNDTHPSIAIPEMMRILLDQYQLDWDRAWSICTRTFSYTNHTLLPEALESWTVTLLGRLLPRHLQIIYEINRRFLRDITHWHPGDTNLLRRMSIISEESEKRVRMGPLAIVGSHKVNGVAKLHTELMKHTTFQDYHRFYPDKFVNITNGITPRRWLNQANPGLAQLITSRIGDKWKKDLFLLKNLNNWVEDETFQSEFQIVKQHNKEQLAKLIHHKLGIVVNTQSIFDVQIKRIHEYKRQLLNLLHVITLYNRIRQNQDYNIVPRTIIFSGKAAPAYLQAKLIINLINDVADIINNDPAMREMLKVIFIPNYDVSTAMKIIPAADLSEQISLAGTEASGTGNMKLSLNGALTVGTLDGANIEISEEVGLENIFIFGLTAKQVSDLAKDYNPWNYYLAEMELKEALDMIRTGYFSIESPDKYHAIFDSLTSQGDQYFLLADYASYVACQNTIGECYRDRTLWVKKAILNVANLGMFSSDRTIMEYCTKIWKATPANTENKC